MSLLIAAVVAVVAAILESSVATQLLVMGVKPDLVFGLVLGVAMVMGFEDGVLVAFLGGLTLDLLLPLRPVGSTTLTLMMVVGLALLVARATEPPRLIVVAATAFALSFCYQGILLVLLAMTAGVRIASLPIPTLTFIGVLDTLLAVAVGWLVRAFILRFGRADRARW